MSLKLLQVEYAKTVHEGSAAEGIYCKDIVVLISQQSGGAKNASKAEEPNYEEVNAREVQNYHLKQNVDLERTPQKLADSTDT